MAWGRMPGWDSAHWFEGNQRGARCGVRMGPLGVRKMKKGAARCGQCLKILEGGPMSEIVSVEDADIEVVSTGRGNIGRKSEAPPPVGTPMIQEVLPAEAAELYHKHFTNLAVRYGMLPSGLKWDALDEASKALHTAAWREMLASLRQPRETRDPSRLPEVLDGIDSDDPRPSRRGRARRG